jgi:hypothetical protein
MRNVGRLSAVSENVCRLMNIPFGDGTIFHLVRQMRNIWASIGVNEKAAGGIILRPPGSKYINAEKLASPVSKASQETIDSEIEKCLFR